MSKTLNLSECLLTMGRDLHELGRHQDASKVLDRLAGFRDLPAAVAEECHARLADIHLSRKQWTDFQFKQLHESQAPPAKLDEPVFLPFVRRAMLPEVPEVPKLPGRRIRLDRDSVSKPHLPRPAWKPDTKHAP